MKIDDNLLQLPALEARLLCQYLNGSNYVPILCSHIRENLDQTCLLAQKNPAEQLIFELANRGFTIKQFLQLLDNAKLDRPQLILKRKFKPVRIVQQPNEPTIDNRLVTCLAASFPYPKYQWFLNDILLDGAVESAVDLFLYGAAIKGGTIKCKIWNEVPENQSYSQFYRQSGKEYYSEIYTEEISIQAISHLLVVSEHLSEHDSCSVCGCAVASSNSACTNASTQSTKLKFLNDCYGTRICAVDKVALIMANSAYQYLPPLLAPLNDAAILAAELTQQGFKTVTLADLTLPEMRSAVRQYAALLGDGVYAVFYFVGHGIEAIGQCYLLPVETPRNYDWSHCFCAQEVLGCMQQANPALNVILLDVCRRDPPAGLDLSLALAYRPLTTRNSVFGYATSYGEGAYEVRGEAHGIFMKYFKEYISKRQSITHILESVIRDVGLDPRACDCQFPELRHNLRLPRSLADPILCTGHTTTFNLRTYQWQCVHELPEPCQVNCVNPNLHITIWFDFYEYYSNVVYVFASCTPKYDDDDLVEHGDDFNYSLSLYFPECLAVSDREEIPIEKGYSVRYVVKNIQKLHESLFVDVEMLDENKAPIARVDQVEIGSVLVSCLKLGVEVETVNSEESDSSTTLRC